MQTAWFRQDTVAAGTGLPLSLSTAPLMEEHCPGATASNNAAHANQLRSFISALSNPKIKAGKQVTQAKRARQLQ